MGLSGERLPTPVPSPHPITNTPLLSPPYLRIRFKTACRALGLPNWPYRRRKSVAALLDNIAGEEEAAEVVRILKVRG